MCDDSSRTTSPMDAIGWLGSSGAEVVIVHNPRSCGFCSQGQYTWGICHCRCHNSVSYGWHALPDSQGEPR